jgi:hypothetical protein
MTNSGEGIFELADQHIDLVSGGEGETREQAEKLGENVANAIEDAVEYVHGFFVGIGNAFSNGR